MGWLASFKGLKSLGVPPVVAVVALGALFFLVRRGGSEDAVASDAAAA